LPFQANGPLIDLPVGHPCADCAIRPITICRRLDSDTLAALRALGTRQRLEPGQPVFHEGDEVKRVFMLATGAMKIYTLLADGRRQITGFMFAGDFLGVSVDDEYAFTAEALVRSELWWFTRDAFEQFVDTHPKVERELYRLAAHELAAAQAQMVLLGRKTAAERIASLFLSLIERQEMVTCEAQREFDLPMSRLDIADYVGLTKETVSRMLAHLRTRKLIRLVTQDRIEILDRDGLKDMAQGFGE